MFYTNADPKRLSPPNISNSFMALFTEINSQILAGVDYKEILNFIFDSPELKIPFDRIGIALITGQGDESRMTLDWTRSKVPAKYLQVPYSALIKGSSLHQITESGEARIISNLNKYLESHPTSESTRLIIKDGIQSNLTCPVRYDGQTIGVVFFSSCQTSTYNVDHINFFSDLSNEISLVLNHARLQNDFKVNKLNETNLRMTLHDLKSPLSTLYSFSELALTEDWFATLDQEAQSIFKIFFKNTKYMLNLLSELNDVTSLKNGNTSLELSEVNLPKFIDELISSSTAMAAQKEMTFVDRRQANLPATACFDQHKIMRVLENLLSNAIKFSFRKTQIEIFICATESRITFSVVDHGQGIPAIELSKLFKDFGKTSVRPTENEGSTGQGLAIAKQIIKLHAGEINVESIEGFGSKFSFWLPLIKSLDRKNERTVEKNLQAAKPLN